MHLSQLKDIRTELLYSGNQTMEGTAQLINLVEA